MEILNNYLKDNSNSLVREELFNYRLFYDLKKAAAERAYHLKIFSTPVDFEGYDIVIGDNNRIGRYQIKSRFNSNTSTWKIHKRILLPNSRNANLMNYDNGLCSSNDNGVILIDIKPSLNNESEYDIAYYYTDYYIIKAIGNELINRNKVTITKANKILEQLLSPKERLNSKISVSLGLFVKTKDPSCLLAFCGFENKRNIWFNKSIMNLFQQNRLKIKAYQTSPEYIADKEAFLRNIAELTYD